MTLRNKSGPSGGCSCPQQTAKLLAKVLNPGAQKLRCPVLPPPPHFRSLKLVIQAQHTQTGSRGRAVWPQGNCGSLHPPGVCALRKGAAGPLGLGCSCARTARLQRVCSGAYSPALLAPPVSVCIEYIHHHRRGTGGLCREVLQELVSMSFSCSSKFLSVGGETCSKSKGREILRCDCPNPNDRWH